jgi:hypothetical protein
VNIARAEHLLLCPQQTDFDHCARQAPILSGLASTEAIPLESGA